MIKKEIHLPPVMSWDEANNIANNLVYDKGEYSLGLLIMMGIHIPTLVSEMLRLTWGDLLDSKQSVVKGITNNKGIFITFNEELRELISNVFQLTFTYNLREHKRSIGMDEPVMVRNGVAQHPTHINRFFANLHKDKWYPELGRPIEVSSLRATFGRRVIDQYGQSPEVMTFLKKLLGQPSANGVRKVLYYDILTDKLTIEDVFSNLHKERETIIEVDKTVHRGKFL